MNLQATIELYGGGPGSGCNPDVGKCGRPTGSGKQGGVAIQWKRERDPGGVQNKFTATIRGKVVEIKRDTSPTRIGKFRWMIEVNGQPVGKAYYKNSKAARNAVENNPDKFVGLQEEQGRLFPRPDVVGPSPTERESSLAAARITEATDLDGGAMGTVKVKFEDGTYGVFKPKSGERAARDDIEVGTYYQREAVAWDVAKIVGDGLEKIVPETVVRKAPMRTGGKEEIGSVQKFVENGEFPPADRWGGFRGVVIKDFVERVKPDDLAKGAAFDWVMSNTDRHYKNMLLTGGIDVTGKRTPQGSALHGIDHGLILGSEGWTSSSWLEGATKIGGGKIPDYVKTAWSGKWDRLKGAMERREISAKQIEVARGKYEKLLKAENWKELAPNKNW